MLELHLPLVSHRLLQSLRGSLIVALALLASRPDTVSAQCGGRWIAGPQEAAPWVDWIVQAMTRLPDGDLVVAGSIFRAGGVPVNNIARWDSESGVWTSLGSGLNDRVRAVVVLPNGDVIAGGYFTHAGGAPAQHVARWSFSSNTWAPLGGGTDGPVESLAVLPDGDIVAGGAFSVAGTVAANRIARWNQATGTWTALGSGIDSPATTALPWTSSVVSLLVLPDGDVVAGGIFETAGGQPAKSIARWNGSQWSALGTGVSGPNGQGYVSALASLPNGDVIAAGNLTVAGGQPVNLVARWDGSSWSALGSQFQGANSSINSLLVTPAGDLIVGGYFPRPVGGIMPNVARWNGSAWTTLASGMGDVQIFALASLANGDIVAAGGLSNSGALSPVRNIGRWNGAAWLQLGPGMDASVRSFATLPDGSLVVGGRFRTAGDIRVSRIARWDGTGWAALGRGLAGSSVDAVAVTASGDVIAAGFFSGDGFTQAQNIARWNGNQWSQMIADLIFGTKAIRALPDGDLIVVGWFQNFGDVPARSIVRLTDGVWTPVGEGIDGILYAVAVLANGDLVVGGSFASAGSVAANNVARWNGSSWSPLGSGVNGPVIALATLPNGDLIAAGGFSAAGDAPANNIARWDGQQWAPLGPGLEGAANALAVMPNGDLIAGGTFTAAGTLSVNMVARWNGTQWSALGSGVDVSPISPSAVLAMAVSASGELIVGGQFARVGDVPSGHFARWTDTGIPWVARQPASPLVPATRVATLSAFCASGYDFNGPVTFQWRRNGVNIADGSGGASVGGGGVAGATGELSAANLGATLTISGVQPSDAGEYTVVFTNACGSVTSAPATLFITPAPCSLADVASVGGVAPPDGLLTGDDFNAFIAAFAAGDSLADITGIGGPPSSPDGLLTGDDFNAFIAAFASGCP